jgi:hypothetical protein
VIRVANEVGENATCCHRAKSGFSPRLIGIDAWPAAI